MKYIKYMLMLTFSFVLFMQANGQDDISPERKAAIDSLALEKVRDLSKYISILGNKETPYSEAIRVIDRALELFMDGSEMGVSSLYRKKINFVFKK